MAALCFVTTCMGRLGTLRQAIVPMLERDGSCIVVDYSCPDGAGDWVIANHPGAQVIRVPDQANFNASAARNIGARHADRPWICFVDSDVVLDPEFSKVMSPVLRPGGFYRAFSSDRGLGGTFVCSRADFERVVGYDEMYQCWGEEDNDLYDALQFVGLEPRSLPEHLLRHLPHGDLERTRFYPIADRVLGHAINRVYRILKWDVARLGRELLDEGTRRALYEKTSEVVAESIRSGRPGDLTVRMPVGLVPGGRSLSRQLVYRLALDGQLNG
jgi:glycosyltransferase involved in cell wall biosynthesis